MERYWIWYALQLKAWCRTRTCWIQTAGMLFVVYVILNITLPQQDNIQVGICNSKGEYAAEISELLLNGESVFSFREYDGEEALGADVSNGVLECGFVFSDDFDQRFADSEIKNCVKYMETPFTTKGKVAKETFYASFFQVYGRILLKNQVPELFADKQEKMLELILEKNQEYRNGDVVFSAEIQTVDTGQSGGENSVRTRACLPVQGCVGIFLFAILLTAYGRSFENRSKVQNALGAFSRGLYELLGYWAVMTIAAATGIFVVFLSGSSRQGAVEIVRMAVYFCWAGIWMLLFQKLWRKRTTFAAWMAVLVMLQFLIYPVFFDFSEYVPVLRYARWLFPLAAYL